LIGIDASRAAIVQRTGTEVYSLHLIRGLLQIGTAHRFRLYFNAPPPPGLFRDVPHCERRVMPFPRLWTHLRLSAEVGVHPPDVLFVPSHVLPLIHPRRSVVTVHDVGYRYYPAAHTAAQRRYLEWSTRYHARAAAHVLADSGATREDLCRFYGADPAQITVVYPGIDPALRPVQDPAQIAAVRRKYGIAQAYMLYVGTLQPRKNLVRLIEAYAQIANRKSQIANGEIGKWGNGEMEKWGNQQMGKWANGQVADGQLERSTRQLPNSQTPKLPNPQLVLAGKRGWLYEEILARAQGLGLENRVIFTGYVEDADLAALYSGARLFAMPSLYEGFCFPVLEAMACGVPVVCSNTSSLPEVVGDAALAFDPLDVDAIAAAMARALSDEEWRATLIAHGFERVERFTWERCARQTLDVLERVGSRS